MGSDKLSLKNMVFYGHHGVFPVEKDFGQRIEVDVDLFTDFSAAGRVDDLATTINYVDIYTIVKVIVEQDTYDLIEALALAISERIIGGYDLEKVTVRVRKPQPPVGGLMDTVEFEVSRGRK
jgi:7,8-dihydroneopterin aldolase/epimerase/oxygenase